MNANEVIANLANRIHDETVHPNDHVNLGQSSNDVIPTAIHLSAALGITETLLPALDHLADTIERKADELSGIVKTGRPISWMPCRFDSTRNCRVGRRRFEPTTSVSLGFSPGSAALRKAVPRSARASTRIRSLEFASQPASPNGPASPLGRGQLLRGVELPGLRSGAVRPIEDRGR